ncbi:MAG: haloacid dehalogenase-like hydrolase [Thermoleophilia bacterium]|nr:haloacid dehalogenase-like hydrolase [Thermoleophilia bacterium]
MTRAVAIDLDGALGDTRALWQAFLEDAARRFRSIAELDVGSLPADRAAAADALDGWASAGIGDWRSALERFAEDHAPVYLRPSGAASAALRRLAAAGWRVGVFTDAPEELARVALAQLGAARRVDTLETGRGARERLLGRLGAGAAVAASAAELVALAAG